MSSSKVSRQHWKGLHHEGPPIIIIIKNKFKIFQKLFLRFPFCHVGNPDSFLRFLLSTSTLRNVIRTVEKKPRSLCMWSAWFGLSDSSWSWDPLLFHSVGLGTQDETVEVVVWNSRAPSSRSWSSTPLIIQSGALALN